MRPIRLCLLPLLLSCFSTKTPAQWHWQNPGPQGNDLRAVFAPAPDQCWMAGEHGTLLRWQNGLLEPVISGTTATLTGLWFEDTEHGWAVGHRGAILRFENNVWQIWPSGTAENLNDIWFNTPADGWAVGNAGTVLHFNGQAWSLQKIPDGVLTGIAFSATGTGWISTWNGRIFRFDGSAWALQTSLFNDLWGCDLDFWGPPEDSNLIVHGIRSTLNDDLPMVWRFNGTNWAYDSNIPNYFLEDVALRPNGSILTASRFGLLESIGNQLNVKFAPPPGRQLLKLHAPSDDQAWAVGRNGALLHFHDGDWQILHAGSVLDLKFGGKIFSPGSGLTADWNALHELRDGFWQEKLKWPQSLRSFDASDANTGTVAFFWGTDTLRRLQNGQLAPDLDAPKGFSMDWTFHFADSSVFVAGALAVWHFDGKDWSREFAQSDSEKAFTAIDFLNDSTGCAVGMATDPAAPFPFDQKSSIWLRHFPGDWELLDDRFRPNLASVDVLHENDIWFGGGFPPCHTAYGGVDTAKTFIYRWKDGVMSLEFEIPEPGGFHHLKMLTPEVGYAITCEGRVYHRDAGHGWQRLELPTDHPIRSVAALDTGRVWLFGDGGLILAKGDNGPFLPAPPSPAAAAQLTIFPNPASEAVEISFPQIIDNQAFLQVFDARGRLLCRVAVPEKSTRCMVSGLSEIPPGVCFLVLTDGRRVFSGEIVIK